LHQKVSLREALGLLFCLCLVAVACFLGVIDDQLLFKSDVVSLAHFFLGCALALFVPTAGAVALTLRGRAAPWLTRAILGLSSFGFLFSSFLYVTGPFMNLPAYFAWLMAFLAFSLLVVPRHLDLPLARKKLGAVGKVALPVGAAAFLVLAGTGWVRRMGVSSQPTKNVVMVVLDGFSAYTLPVYNPREKALPEFDALREQALLFKNVYTNHTHTSGYFSALYGGRKAECQSAGEQNLFGLLQSAGVNARWSVYHPNAIPEATLAASYKGLRSNYLNDTLAIVPYAMGLDYHVYRFSGTRANDAPLVKLINRLLRQVEEKATSDLRGYFETEVARLHADKRPFFLLLHTNSAGEAPVHELAGPIRTELWEDPSRMEAAQKQFAQYINANDYTYRPSDTPLIERAARDNRAVQTTGLRVIGSLLETLRKKGWDRDTVMLVTADHGKIFRNGRVNYGFHNDEDVTRVLMLAFNHSERGTSDRLRETIDVSKTVLDLFGVRESLDPSALSLFESRDKDFLSSLTLPSQLRSEVWMNLYFKGDGSILRFAKNIAKDRPPSLQKVVGFDPVPMTGGSSYPLAEWYALARKQYCLN
jgi:hypothetical protein